MSGRHGWLTGPVLVAALVVPATGLAEPPADSELVLESAEHSLGVDFDRFGQEVEGLPVLGSEVVVTRERGEPAEVVVDRSVEEIESPGRAEIARAEGIRLAEAAIGLRDARGPTRGSAAIAPDGEGGTRVWRVTVPARRPLGDFEVLVDARSGEILSRRNLLEEARGRGLIFNPNPVVTNGGLRDGLSDARDADSPALTALRLPVVLRRLHRRSTCLDGPFVAALARHEEVCDERRDWTDLTRGVEGFEAVMVYFHITRTQSYIRSLGIRGASPEGLTVDVNAIAPDNSFFSRFLTKITYGRGGVDDAEDADAIVHEYGHAVQDAQVPGFGDDAESTAIAEGFGDYLAAALTAIIPGTSTEDAACVFEWDTTPLGIPCLRRTDRDLTRQAVTDPPCRSEPHCVGELWSGSLWRLRQLLGPDADGKSVMDRLVFQSNFALSRSARLRAAAQAVIQADEHLYSGVHRPALEAEFSARGLL